MHTSTQDQRAQMVHLTANDVPEFLASRPGLVVIEVSTDWCVPCHFMRPVMRKMAFQFADHMTVAGVDGDTARPFLKSYEIDSFPQLLFFKNGELVRRHIGFQDADSIRNLILESRLLVC